MIFHFFILLKAPSNKKDQNSDQIESDSLFANLDSAGNIFYDGPGNSVKSTQQINLDYSKFENLAGVDRDPARPGQFWLLPDHCPYLGQKVSPRL